VVEELSNLRNKLVLVIDDETDARILLTHLIEEIGCRVIAAHSGELGLRMAREFQPDLITVDLLMPKTSGWDVVKMFKADPQLQSIPVVVVSVIASENRGTVLGAVDVLQKPVSREDLLRVLRMIPRPKVLVIDDNEDDRRLLAAFLEEDASEIRLAVNGRQALEVLEDFLPDLVLLDLMMPVMDGMTFLNEIRKDPRYHELPVVVVTAKELTGAEVAFLQRQAQAVLRKAGDMEQEITRLLHEVLTKKKTTTRARS
jgi:CheY-like chemotaxis protein